MKVCLSDDEAWIPIVNEFENDLVDWNDSPSWCNSSFYIVAKFFLKYAYSIHTSFFSLINFKAIIALIRLGLLEKIVQHFSSRNGVIKIVCIIFFVKENRGCCEVELELGRYDRISGFGYLEDSFWWFLKRIIKINK